MEIERSFLFNKLTEFLKHNYIFVRNLYNTMRICKQKTFQSMHKFFIIHNSTMQIIILNKKEAFS